MIQLPAMQVVATLRKLLAIILIVLGFAALANFLAEVWHGYVYGVGKFFSGTAIGPESLFYTVYLSAPLLLFPISMWFVSYSLLRRKEAQRKIDLPFIVGITMLAVFLGFRIFAY